MSGWEGADGFTWVVTCRNTPDLALISPRAEGTNFELDARQGRHAPVNRRLSVVGPMQSCGVTSIFGDNNLKLLCLVDHDKPDTTCLCLL